MQEAAALKVREYVSRGIPFIKAYYDTDIDNIPELSSYYLNFPNDDSIIEIEKIIQFLEIINQMDHNISEKMHEIAVEKIDWIKKMKDYMNGCNI